MYRSTYKAFTFLLLGLCQCILFAQERSVYNGPFQIGTFSGNARYQYILKNTDTIFDGSFLFQRSNLETLLQEQDSSFTIKGSFKESFASGPWLFQFGEYTSESKSEVVDFEYRILVSGTQEMAQGLLSEGIPDGEWNLTIQEVENSEATNTLFKSTFNFEKGIPQQNFSIENDSSALVGRFLRNGMAHDEWTSYGSNALEVDEVWYFEEGLLQKIVFDTTGKEVAVFENGMAQFRTVPLDDRFLLVLEYNLQERFDESSITALLSKNREQYQKINSLLTRLGSTSFATNMKVKVPVYPLDSLQLESLKNIALHFDRATEIASTILTNSHLNIVRRTDGQAQYWYSIAREIETNFIKPLSIYVDLYENQIFEFVNPITIQERIFPMGMPNKSIRLDGDESGDSSSFQLPDAEKYEFNGNDLLSIEQLSAFAQESLEYIRSQLADKLSDDKQLQSLKELENDLVSINTLIEKQIDSLLPGFTENYTNAFKNLGESANIKLGFYAGMANPNEKLRFGEQLKSCLEDTKSLITNLSLLPAKTQEIKAIYTDDIWNPFMATVMEEEVKKRLVEAYTDILIPYFLQRTLDSIECEQIALLNEQIIFTNNRMVDLRNRETRKLERKLKRSRNAEEVLELLHQFTIPKEE